MVYRTARCGLRATAGQRCRLFGLLRSAGDVWCCVLELNAWRRRRQDPPLAGYRELCRELASAGPGTFGELDTRALDRCCAGILTPGSQSPSAARPVTRQRGSRGAAGAWCRCAGMRARSRSTGGGCGCRWRGAARRWWCGWTGIAVPCGPGPLSDRAVRGGPAWAEVTAEVPVERIRTARVRIGPGGRGGPGGHPPVCRRRTDGELLLVSGRAIRAECRQHLHDARARRRAVARRAPKPGQRGSRRWRQHRRRQRAAEARHQRRVRQAQHEAARTVIGWAVAGKIGTLAVGDPRGVSAWTPGGGTTSVSAPGGSGT